MKRYGMTNSQLKTEIGDDPEWAAEALGLIMEESGFRQTELDKARGDYKMGDEVHGNSRTQEQWMKGRQMKHDANIAAAKANLRAKGKDTGGF